MVKMALFQYFIEEMRKICPARLRRELQEVGKICRLRQQSKRIVNRDLA